MGHLVWGYNRNIMASIGGGVGAEVLFCYKIAPAAFKPLSLTELAQQIWSMVLKAVPLLAFRLMPKNLANSLVHPQFQFLQQLLHKRKRRKECRLQIYRSKSKHMVKLHFYISSYRYESLCHLSHKENFENMITVAEQAADRLTTFTRYSVNVNKKRTVLQQRCLPQTEGVHKASLDISGSDVSAASL